MVHDDEPVGLDGLRVEFDDERAVSDAGVMLVATLAERLGIEALAGRLVRLRRDRPGAANAGRKVMALMYAMVLGADSIDDCERVARGPHAAGCWAAGCRRPRRWGRSCARSRSGTCASSTRCSGEALERAWQAGAGPGRRAAGDRRRQLRRRGLRPLEAGRRLRLHQAARLPPDPRDPGRHARGAAHPAAEGLGEHAEGDAALRRRADRPRRPRRRDRRQAAARRLGVLEHQGVRAARAGRLAVLDRRADASRRSARRSRRSTRTPGRRSTTPTRARRRSPRPPTAAGG